MAVALDTSNSTFNNTADSNTITLAAYTCSGANRLLLVCVEVDFDASPSVTFGGSAMTSLDAQNDGSGANRLAVFYTLGPTTSASDIVLSKTNSWGGILATSWTGVSSTPFGTVVKTSGTGSSPTVTISTGANDMAVSFVFGNNPTTFTANNGQTKLAGPNFNPGLVNAGYVTNGTTLSWTLNTSQAYAELGIPVLAGTQASPTNGSFLLNMI